MTRRLLALALLSATPAAAQLYKCVGADGKTAYQAHPCQEGARQSAVQTREAKGVSTAQHSMPLSEVEKVVSRYRACVAYSSDFAESHRPAFEQWRTRHAAAYSAFESDPVAVQRVKDGFEAEKRRQAALTRDERFGYYSRCQNEVGALLSVSRRTGPEPDYMKVIVNFRTCRRVVPQDGLDGKFTAWMRRNQEGYERFSREHEPGISNSVDEGVAAFKAADASAQSATRALCRGDLHRWLEEGA